MKIHSTPRHFAVIDLDTAERRLLTSLFSDTAALLADDKTSADDTAPAADAASTEEWEKMLGLSSGERPDDPAVLRLLPDVAADDPERSAEFRRLTEFDLREGKLANLRTALHSLAGTGRVELDEVGTRAWLIALTDVRLVIATRLGIATDDDFEDLYGREAELDERTAMMLSVYDFLTWAQERLADIMLADLGES